MHAALRSSRHAPLETLIRASGDHIWSETSSTQLLKRTHSDKLFSTQGDICTFVQVLLPQVHTQMSKLLSFRHILRRCFLCQSDKQAGLVSVVQG